MGDFELRVIRPDDLLVLRFEFVNLTLGPDDGAPRRLLRTRPDLDAYLLVHLPPQHVADAAFDALVGPPVDEPVPALIAGESRLAFRLPADLPSLPLTLDALLAWAQLTPLLAELDEQEEEPHQPSPPPLLCTAIELPYRIIVRPTSGGSWEHRVHPPAASGTVELWHTRHVSNNLGPGFFNLAAIWSPDLDDPDDFIPVSLTARDRVQIVRLSSDKTLLHESSFDQLSPAEIKQLVLLRAQRSSRIKTRNLVLSALGGWLAASSDFTFPKLGALAAKWVGSPPVGWDGELFSLDEWRHTAMMGRDQYVRTVHRGFLYPYGHRASLVTVTERAFGPSPAGDAPAYLFQQQFLVVQEIERRYDHRAMPFVSMRLTGEPVVRISVEVAPGPVVPKVKGEPYRFPMLATDRQGHTAQVAVAAVFVPADVTDLGLAADQYAWLAEVDLGSQQVAFTAPTSGPADRSAPDVTTLTTLAVRFRPAAEQLADGTVIPMMDQARVRVPAAEQLLGPAAGPASIAFNQAYLASGVEGAANGVFADIVGGLSLPIPAEKAGGIVAPAPMMTALSVVHGAFADVTSMAHLPPEQVLEQVLKGKLLGFINLKDLVTLSAAPASLPTLRTANVPGGRQVTLDWQPQLKASGLPDPLRPFGGQPTLSVQGTLLLPANAGIEDAASDVCGTLRHVALSFLDVVTVGFTELTFHLRAGQAPAFGADVGDVSFDGDLAFVRELASALPLDGLGGGKAPPVQLTREGITVSIRVALPSISLGLLNLANLAFTAELTVLFSDAPATLCLALSSRADPFLISYSIFGGGGHFALTAGTDGRVQVEASLEFGGVAALDIALAKGVVQAMVGIFFAMDGDAVALGGYVRIYGCVEVLGIISISVEFYLSLCYRSPYAVGCARLTVMVRVLAWSKSVSLEVERRFGADATAQLDRPGQITLDQWTEYCCAYAGTGRWP